MLADEVQNDISVTKFLSAEQDPMPANAVDMYLNGPAELNLHQQEDDIAITKYLA